MILNQFQHASLRVDSHHQVQSARSRRQHPQKRNQLHLRAGGQRPRVEDPGGQTAGEGNAVDRQAALANREVQPDPVRRPTLADAADREGVPPRQEHPQDQLLQGQGLLLLRPGVQQTPPGHLHQAGLAQTGRRPQDRPPPRRGTLIRQPTITLNNLQPLRRGELQVLGGEGAGGQVLGLVIKINSKMESKDSGSMAEYYSKISEIRARILSKHGIASPQMAPVPSSQPRHSLPQDNSDGSFVETRVRELECVNDRIKSILAAKRSPSVSNPTSDKYLSKGPVQLPIKRKLFSLFQDENNILESKVTNTKLEKGGYCQSRLIRDVSYEREKFQTRGEFDGKEVELNYKLPEMSLQDYRNKYQSSNSQGYKDMQVKPTLAQTEDKYKIVQPQQPKPRESQPQVRQRQRQEAQVQRQQPVASYSGESERQKLVKLLAKQAELQGSLRQEKQLFAEDKSSDKWSKLSTEISRLGSNLTQSQIEIWASISPEEFNPFADLNRRNVDMKKLAQALLSAKNHWQKSLKDCVSIRKLEDQGFSMGELDLGGKGYLCIEDLVCFINLNSDSCLRNRDLCSLFRRWRQLSSSSDAGLPFIAFLNHVAK